MKKGQNIRLFLFFDVLAFSLPRSDKGQFSIKNSFNTAQCISQINV